MDFQTLQNMTVDELLLLLADSLPDDELCAAPKPDKEKFERAREYLNNNLIRCSKVLCGNRVIANLSRNGKHTELLAAVAALIESLVAGTAVSPVAALICKYGLERLCRAEWGNHVP